MNSYLSALDLTLITKFNSIPLNALTIKLLHLKNTPITMPHH